MAKKNIGKPVKVREPWYKSRRIWGAIISSATGILALFPIPFKAEIVTSLGIIGGAFGLTSYLKPK